MTRSSLKLLYLLPAEGFGGAERQGVYHLAELPRHGVEVTSFVGPGQAVHRALVDAGRAHENFRHFPDRGHAPMTFGESAGYLAHWLHALSTSVREIERATRGQRFDLIFANRTFAWLVAAMLSRKLRVPYVIRAGSRPSHPGLLPALSLLGSVAKPAAAFYNCRAVERAFGTRLGCPAYGLPNAIDTDRFAPGKSQSARARLGLSTEGPVIGLAARPAPEKGFDLFANVVRGVCAKRPGARFVVAGEFGWRQHYQAKLHSMGLGEAVRFMGHVAAMPDFYRASDIVILTSRERSIEASPNALLEAMAVGRPIVSTAVGGVPELVRDGIEGHLVADGDAVGFTRLLLGLFDAPARCRELGESGRARALEHGITTVVSELSHILSQIALKAFGTSSIGGLSCESTTHSAPSSTFWSEERPSKSSWW